jgi:hypothetical protein
VKQNKKHFDKVTACRIKCIYSGKYKARRIEEEANG